MRTERVPCRVHRKFAEFVYVLHCFRRNRSVDEDAEGGHRAHQGENADGGSRLQTQKGSKDGKQKRVSAEDRQCFSRSRLKNPEELLAKAKLAARVVQIIEGRGLNQTQAAKLLGVDQPKVSQIYRGRLDDFSIERLMRFLTALDQDVRISSRTNLAGGAVE